MFSFVTNSFKQIRITKTYAFLLLLLIGLVVYGRSAFSEFLFDDEFLVLVSDKYHSLSNIPGFFFGFDPAKQNNFALYYRPIAYTIETINYFLFQEEPFFYRLLRMLVHIGNSYVLFLVFKKFLKERWALLGAVFFLVLPINIEAIMWTLDGGMLFFIFGISALAVVMYYPHRKFALPLSAFLLFCSILTKESGYIFMGVQFLYVLMYEKKLLKQYTVTFIALVVGTFIMRNIRLIPFSYSNMNNAAPINVAPLNTRLLNISPIISYYFKTFFFPLDLAIAQHWLVRTVNDMRFIMSLVLNTLVIGFFMGAYAFTQNSSKKTTKSYIFFFLWFVGGIVTSLQFIPLTMTVADRWFYMSAAGLTGMILIFLSSLNHSHKRLEIPLMIVTILVIGIFSARTMIRIADWQNAYTLYSHDLPLSPQSHQLENNLAGELAKQNRNEEALEHLRKAHALFPSILNSTNLALVTQQIAYTKLRSGDAESARKYAREGLKSRSDSAELWIILAMSEYQLKNYDEAVKSAEQAYKYEPTPRVQGLIDGMKKRVNINLQ